MSSVQRDTAGVAVRLENRSKDIFLEDIKRKKGIESEDILASCEDGQYSKRTLKLAYELAFASLFTESKGQKESKASEVIVTDYGVAYAL